MSNDTTPMVSCQSLVKRYGDKVAVNGLDFTVPRGQVLGFLGPNGAGKTTTMRLLTCYLAPTSGTAKIAGHDVSTHSLDARRLVGYLPEETPLYRDMIVCDYLEYVTRMRKIPAGERRARIKKTGEATGLLSVMGKRIGELSKGYRQRVGLAQAIIHDPPLMILDEPTSGLDPNQIVEIRDLIKELGREKTVILSTHILPEVRATCDRVLIISDGRIVADGRPDDLVARERSGRFRLLLDSSAPSDAEVTERLLTLAGAVRVTREPTESGTAGFVVDTDGALDLRPEIFRLAVARGWGLLELERREASLEEVFQRLTRSDAAATDKPGPADGDTQQAA